MKSIIVLCFIGAGVITLPASLCAQKALPTQRKLSDSVRVSSTGTDVWKYNSMNEVIQSTGKTYNSEQLQRMAAKDINQIANTVPGVQSRPGEPLMIRGTNTGTAYFVDGVRVYGALPPIMK